MAGNQRRPLIENSKIEGSKMMTKVTAEVLWSFILQQRLPSTNQAVILIDSIRGIGEQLIAANPVVAEQFKAPNLSNVISKPEPSTTAQDDKDVAETGVEPKDIELVMMQAGVSRANFSLVF